MLMISSRVWVTDMIGIAKRTAVLITKTPSFTRTTFRRFFGEKYYNVDLQTGLQNAGKIYFASLLDNLVHSSN